MAHNWGLGWWLGHTVFVCSVFFFLALGKGCRIYFCPELPFTCAFKLAFGGTCFVNQLIHGLGKGLIRRKLMRCLTLFLRVMLYPSGYFGFHMLHFFNLTA